MISIVEAAAAAVSIVAGCLFVDASSSSLWFGRPQQHWLMVRSFSMRFFWLPVEKINKLKTRETHLNLCAFYKLPAHIKRIISMAFFKSGWKKNFVESN